ncbi:GntR family transcriptional regulator [Allopusillimonas ginsengisoli]|uniref:GntR family transcriptional regulator n=1 Tax=Allopusillimonas ginsengisoli TaxID=453575 RepID=UPI001020E369|nr:GntR family transcriptional regulator [Allopusillimonas ginsengisoli]TEA79588.1 GntR family transcriptional regulator [Allopusillimonas ginsengisoli]
MNGLLNPTPRRETLGANILAQIKELLLTGQLMPGEQLSLRSTAEALGVSVMPVREAVYQLVADQALEVAPNRSVRVPMLSAAQFHEITQIRLQIEGYAVEQATGRMTAALLDTLRATNARLAQEMDAPENNMADVVQLNKALHFSLYAAAGMPMLDKIIESLWLRIGPILNYDLRAGSERIKEKTAVRHHANMLDALEAGDAPSARSALCNDIESAYAHILAKHYSEP